MWQSPPVLSLSSWIFAWLCETILNGVDKETVRRYESHVCVAAGKHKVYLLWTNALFINKVVHLNIHLKRLQHDPQVVHKLEPFPIHCCVLKPVVPNAGFSRHSHDKVEISSFPFELKLPEYRRPCSTLPHLFPEHIAQWFMNAHLEADVGILQIPLYIGAWQAFTPNWAVPQLLCCLSWTTRTMPEMDKSTAVCPSTVDNFYLVSLSVHQAAPQ